MSSAAPVQSESSPQAPLAPSLAVGSLEVLLGPQTLRLVEPCVLQAGRLYLLWGPSGSGKSSFAAPCWAWASWLIRGFRSPRRWF